MVENNTQILLAKDFETRILEKIKRVQCKRKLLVVTSGDDPASKRYVANKLKLAQELGFQTQEIHYESNEDYAKIVDIICRGDTGIIIQQPYDKEWSVQLTSLQKLIKPECDIDGLNPNTHYIPATARGVDEFLKAFDLTGKHVVIIGRSKLVGKPLIDLMLKRNATVTSCNSYSGDLSRYTKDADVVISCVGHAHLITADMIKDGCIAIDVGISFDEQGHQVGDFDFENCKSKCKAITPTTKACGRMTVVMLMANLASI